MQEITSFVSLHSEKDTTTNNNDNDKKHDDITIMMIIMINDNELAKRYIMEILLFHYQQKLPVRRYHSIFLMRETILL